MDTSNTVVYHRADFDGHFSAAVCKKFMPEATFIGWDFGDDLIEFPQGNVYLVDLPLDCFKSLPYDASKRLVWIDHHKTSIEKWDHQLGSPWRGYLIDGVAACRLCWQWFMNDYQLHGLGWTLPKKEDFQYHRVEEPLALRLAGEYDVWDHRDERALPFQYGLTAGAYRFDFGLISMLDTPKDLGFDGKWVFPGDAEVKYVVESGRGAMQWQKQFAKEACTERSYVREWEGLTVCILASSHARSSSWFPKEAIPPTCDALMCWRYDGRSVKFSLYHAPGHEDKDLSIIAKKYGGGGHAGACGFELPLAQALEIIR